MQNEVVEFCTVPLPPTESLFHLGNFHHSPLPPGELLFLTLLHVINQHPGQRSLLNLSSNVFVSLQVLRCFLNNKKAQQLPPSEVEQPRIQSPSLCVPYRSFQSIYTAEPALPGSRGASGFLARNKRVKIKMKDIGSDGEVGRIQCLHYRQFFLMFKSRASFCPGAFKISLASRHTVLCHLGLIRHCNQASVFRD